MRTWKLRLRLSVGIFLLFGLLFALFSALGYFFIGGRSFIYFSFGLSLLMLLLQYLIGPAIVRWSMRVRWVTPQEEPELHAVVDELCTAARWPKPRVGISEAPIPNAFAFGRWKSDGRICATRVLMERLTRDELKGVMGHELSHLRHRDVAVTTLLSVIPMVAYHLYLSLFWGSMFGRRDRNAGAAMLVALLAFAVYFVSNLLVLYVNRLRELYADQGGVELTGERAPLASALYKIVHGSARVPREKGPQTQVVRALFAADPVTARSDILELTQADVNRDGRIDEFELDAFARAPGRIGRAERLLEAFSTHPNMVRRIRLLAAE